MNTGLEKNFRVEDGQFGPRLILTGRWTDLVRQFVIANGIVELYLNYALGWEGASIEFVREIPGLRFFWLIDKKIEDVSHVEALESIRVLRLDTTSKSPINFARFPELIETAINWQPGFQSVFDASQLRSFKVGGYTQARSAPFGKLSRLKHLAIYSSDLTEVQDFGQITDMEALLLADCFRLSSLSGVESLGSLTELQLHAVQGLTTIDAIRGLTNLRTLVLNDLPNLYSIAPLSELINLETVILGGKTSVADGDLKPLKSLPRLRSLEFTARRHYSTKKSEFKADVFQNRYSLIL
jgi:Leucine-rich repeat (LRR) protein